MAFSLPLGSVLSRLVHNPVVGTARWIAAARVRESARLHSLSDDLSPGGRGARKFVGKTWFLSGHFRFFEGALPGWAAGRACAPVPSLGAVTDIHARRLILGRDLRFRGPQGRDQESSAAGPPFVEPDHPEAFGVRRPGEVAPPVLAAGRGVPLRSSGFRAAAPMFRLGEGLLDPLGRSAVRRLIEVAAQLPDSKGAHSG
jgi:hypothetical protein